MTDDRWPAGRPAAPSSPFFWAGRDTPEYVAALVLSAHHSRRQSKNRNDALARGDTSRELQRIGRNER